MCFLHIVKHFTRGDAASSCLEPGRHGKARLNAHQPWGGSWPLPFPRASPVSPLVQHQPSGAWLRDPGLKIQPHFPPGQCELGFPWCGNLVRLVLFWRVSVYHWEVFSGSKETFHYIQYPFGLVGETEIEIKAFLEKMAPLFAPLHILSLGWWTCKWPGQAALLSQIGRNPSIVFS